MQKKECKYANKAIYCHYEKDYKLVKDCWPCAECEPCAYCLRKCPYDDNAKGDEVND